MECLALPKGWKREEAVRRSGLSAGKIEVSYSSPSGVKFRTKPQLTKYLGESVDLTSFDFRTGKINASLLHRKAKRSRGGMEYGRAFRSDNSLIPPIRQTASIFKQPVTLIKTQPESKTKSDLKQSNQEKPKQVFWEKRLQNLKCTIPYQDEYLPFELPKNMTAIGPDMTDETVLRSISTALHNNTSGQPITGQTSSLAVLEKNPGVFVDTNQPLMAAVVVSDTDIRQQEDKVQQARKQLQKLISDL